MNMWSNHKKSSSLWESLIIDKAYSNHSIRSNTLFFTQRYFSLLQVQSLFKQAVICLSFLPCNVSHSILAAIFSFPPFWLTLLVEVRHFLYPIHPFLFHIKTLFTINYFLDWEGLRWDFCSPHSYLQCSLFPPSFQLLPTHLTKSKLRWVITPCPNKFLTRTDLLITWIFTEPICQPVVDLDYLGLANRIWLSVVAHSQSFEFLHDFPAKNKAVYTRLNGR